MKKTPRSLRPQAPRAESPGMLRRISKPFSLLPVLVLLMIMAFVPTVSALACIKDSQCRRDVCILSLCGSRPGSGGTCSADTHCFNAATESCINSKCLPRSTTGEVCDSTPDCSKAGDVCTGGTCEIPTFASLMVWDGNQSPLNPSSGTSGIAVNGILFLIEENDAGPLTVEAYDDATKTWTSKTGPGISSYAHSVVAVGTSIFLIGGVGSSGIPLDTFFSYDTKSDKWDTTWDQLPEGRSYIATAAVDNTVFVFGGIDETNTYLDSIRSLDVSAKGRGWNVLISATLPYPTFGLSATTVKNEIFLTGGTGSDGYYISTALKYNTDTPDVSPISINSLNQPRSGHMSFYDPAHDLLYVVGGIYSSHEDTVEVLDLSVSSSGIWSSANAPNYANIFSGYGGLIGSRFYFASFQTLQVLDVSVPASVKWSPFPNSPSPRATVFQMTGPNTITTVDTLDRKTSFYNTVSNTWTTGTAFPFFTKNPTSVVINGEVYIMGGDDGDSAIPTVYALNAAGDSWITKDNLPAGRAGGCAAADGTDIYLYGGSIYPVSAPTSTLFLMDTTMAVGSGQWTTVTPSGATPTAVNICVAVVVDRKLLIFGGGTGFGGSSPTGMIQSFDLNNKMWDLPLAATLLTPRSRFSAVLLNGFVFIIGGTDDNNLPLAKTEAFEVSTQKVSAIKDMPTPRFSLGSVTDGTSVFAVGGQTRSGIIFPSLERLRSP